MAGRFADPESFRGYAARWRWIDVASQQARHSPEFEQRIPELQDKSQTRLVWMCAPTLGVPKSPFTIWSRRPVKSTVQVVTKPVDVGMGVPVHRWSPARLASRVEVSITPADPTRPVYLFALRPRTVPGFLGFLEVFGADSIVGSASGTVAGAGAAIRLGVTCGGAMAFAVVNGSVSNPSVRWLDEDVNSAEWQPVEVVGQPVRGQIPDYRQEKQGFVDDLRDPVEAAVNRLMRGLPLVGWPTTTESFHVAPPWRARDPKEVVDVLSTGLLPRLAGLYGVSEDQMGELKETHAAPPPSGGAGTATLSPFAALTIPAMTDPSFNLATGFGTAYPFGGHERPPSRLLDGLQGAEFMVTAPYDTLPERQGGGEAATIIGPAVNHTSVPSPVALDVAQAALLPPSVRDERFHEAVRVSWVPPAATAAIPAPGQAAFCTFPPGVGDAEPLMPVTPSGGYEPLTLARRTIDSTVKDSDRLNLLHRDAELPFEGSVSRGYAVCTGDVFGLWSSWQDIGYTSAAPTLEGPRIVSVGLTTRYAGSAQCPSELALEVSLGWTERTPRRIEIVAQYWPMATATSNPPPLDPSVAPGAPLFARTLLVDFAGDVPTAASASTSVMALNQSGEPATAPGPVEQGEEGRRYRVTYSGETLDFASVGRWGVRVWARVFAEAPQLPTPSRFSPAPDQPATAVAASPVPVVLPPPPPLPGVPMGSSPDAQGLSHVRVVWPPQATPPVNRVVVWETSESVVLSRLPVPSQPDYTAIPGARLVRLRTAYDGLSSVDQQALFRRVGEFDPGPGALDLTLPKGSRDIHFFMVTAVTTTGVESPWPVATGGGAAHEHVQAFMAPRMLQPAPPVARSTVDPGSGALSFTMESASRIPVEAFEVFATRSELGALDVLTMGPPLARVLVPGIAPAGGWPADAISGDPVFSAEWSGGLPAAWEPWFVRVMAVPKPVVAEAGTRGAFSLPSDLVRVSTVPPGVPGLEPLVVTPVGDGLGFMIDTATSALERAVPAGEFTVSVDAGAGAGGAAPAARGTFAAVPLRSVDAGLTAPGPLALDPSVRRGVRVSGSTPLRIWVARADKAQPLTVTVTVTDPLGRTVIREATIAAGAGVAPPTLGWHNVAVRAAGGLVAKLTSDVPITAEWTLVVTASKPGIVRRPIGGRLGPIFDLGPARTLSGQWVVSAIRVVGGYGRPRPIPVAGAITVGRSVDESQAPTHTFELTVPLAGATSMVAELRGPDGAQVSARWPG